MELVFIHGWGFDSSIWDHLADLLREYPQRRVDLGFYGQLSDQGIGGKTHILIGHSFGLVRGLQLSRNWAGWVAINSFSRFEATAMDEGCVTQLVMRDLRKRLTTDPTKALSDFHRTIGSAVPEGTPNVEGLTQALKDLSTANTCSLLTKLAAPGLILASRNDPLVPSKMSEALRSKRASLLWQDAGGHILPLSHPAWCANAVTNFLKVHMT